jgi:hypothetical protein
MHPEKESGPQQETGARPLNTKQRVTHMMRAGGEPFGIQHGPGNPSQSFNIIAVMLQEHVGTITLLIRGNKYDHNKMIQQ